MYGATYLFDGEDPRPGIEALERARSLLPSDITALLFLGQLYAKANEIETAKTLLRTVRAFAQGGPVLEHADALLQALEAVPSEPSGS